MQLVINQIEITDYEISKNTEVIVKSINEHSICQGNMIFPELSLTGFPTKQNIGDLWKESETYFQQILRASQNTQATIVLGHIEKSNQCFYNSCFFIKNSQIIHVHRKSKLWLDDVGIFSSGKHHSVIDINGTNCGAQICFELEFPEGSRALSKQGAEVIFMPNGNMRPYGNVHYVLTQARAIENQCFVITCNRVGLGHGGEFVGESLVVSPTGDIIKKLGSSQQITSLTIDLHELEQSRKNYNYINLL